jgi:rhodanese-related sulfurtransferase
MRFDADFDVSVQEAVDAIEGGAVLLDVREDVEWAIGHAPDAVHIPISRLGERADELPLDKAIVCVCHIGGRSAMATDALLRGGWKAVNVAGGMQAWAAAGLPVVTDDGRPGTIA